MSSNSVVVSRASNLKSECYIYAAPFPKEDGLSEEKIKEQAEDILRWLSSTIPGSVYDEFIKLVMEKHA